MKIIKLLFLTGLLLGSFAISSIAQKQIASNNLDAFVGTWEYRSSTEYFKVVLQNGTYSSSDFTYQYLVGGYYYEKDGVVIANCVFPIPAVVNDSNHKQVKIKAGSFALVGQPVKKTTIGFTFIDDGKEQKISGLESKLVLLDQNRMRWILREAEQVTVTDGEGNYYPGFEPKPMGFSIPTDVVMTKQLIQLPLPSRPGNSDDETSVIL